MNGDGAWSEPFDFRDDSAAEFAQKFDPEVEVKGVRLRVRLYHKGGSSGIKERIIPPAEGWQQVSFDWDDIGSFRGRLGIEALWHADSIYFDDVQVSDRSTDTMK